MGLYKYGILSAMKSTGFYVWGMFIGWIVGFPLVIMGVIRNFNADWSYEYSMFIGSQFNYWGSLFVSFGFICMVLLIAKSPILQGLQKRLIAVGRMALTNYLTHSVICVFIFYGIGLGLYGSVERKYLLLIVIGIWIIQLMWSGWWLKKYHYGPVEWLWRSLTYMKKQPFRKEEI